MAKRFNCLIHAAVAAFALNVCATEAAEPKSKKQDFEETFLFMLYGEKGESRKDRVLSSDPETCVIKIKEPAPGFGDAEFTFRMNNAYVNGIRREFKAGRWVIVVPSEPELVEINKVAQMYFLYNNVLPDYKNYNFIDTTGRADKAFNHLYKNICTGKQSRF